MLPADHKALVEGLSAVKGIDLTIALLEEVSFFLKAHLLNVRRVKLPFSSFFLALSSAADLTRSRDRYHARASRSWFYTHGVDAERKRAV